MKSAFIRLGAVACLLGLGIPVHAQTSTAGVSFTGVSYTFVDLQYSFAKIDVPDALNGGDLDGGGPYLNGSMALNRYTHAVAGYENLKIDDIEIDDGLGNITVFPTDDVNTYMFGLGVNTPTMGRADRQYRGGLIDRYSLFADARYLAQDSSGSTSNGWQLNAGFRSVNFTRMEVILGVGYEKFESRDGDFTAQGQFL
ncbi:MAG: hypothetical protein ACN4GT_06935, partial [Gammaproteobacteria bacterium]